MTWNELDWSALDRLRRRFLAETANGESYWETPEDLACYDFTYGERIGWKWDQVLRELRQRGFAPGSRRILDWGCGSGVAARRVIAHYGAEAFAELVVWDLSPLARAYAAEAASVRFPTLSVTEATVGFLESDAPVGVLVVSHVLNELPDVALDALRRLIGRADTVLWVEPGTHAVSRRLSRLRDEFLPQFRPVAPCTHTESCPIAAAGHERDWCHFFAPPPPEIFADSGWVKFGQRAGIDLRSLPYAFLALDRRAPVPPDGWSRILGRTEHFKPYARWLNCDASGLSTLELPKRNDPALCKQLERDKGPLVYRWQRDGGKVTGGTPWGAPAGGAGT
jgi:SAM-dependent methyltransferase